MANQLPTKVRERVHAQVFKLADEFGYLSKSRTENAKFMVALVDSAIGRELAQFMPKAEVKTYLKDAVLNRYAKDRRKLPTNVDAYLTPLFPTQKHLVYEKPMSCSLHKCSNSEFLAVARVGVVKYETGLRKLLEFAAKKSAFTGTATVHLVLVVCCHGQHLNEGDKELMAKSLKVARVKTIWA